MVKAVRSVELLAPAGSADCAFSALHYGANAVYLGLSRFSARAEAANFTPEALGEVTSYAHSLTPRRSVYVALNTLIGVGEMEQVMDSLVTIADAGADAVIVQDFGVARLVRRHFPRLRLHASTQMAIHNLDGAKAVADMGFCRVTLARELTLPEIAGIAAESGIEVEVFIHGALCYSYSGLCLYSALLKGRSGNRGRCAYPCRERFRQSGDRGEGLIFSMKDLATPDMIAELCDTGVSSLKIEGRMKSPLYVAATVDFYRRLLQGESLASLEQRGVPDDVRTVFSRPWTTLCLRSTHARDVIDPRFVGHRGVRIGYVEAVVSRAGRDWIRLAAARRLERHDGLQLELEGDEKPFGFSVDALVRQDQRGRWSAVYEAPARTKVLVALPMQHPDITPGVPVYCASSQSVKQKYGFPRPRPGTHKARTGLDVDIRVTPHELAAVGVTRGPSRITAEVKVPGVFQMTRHAPNLEDMFRDVFGKLGNTAYARGDVRVVNAGGLFVPVSVMNHLRRELVAAMDDESIKQRQAVMNDIRALEGVEPQRVNVHSPAWIVKTDRIDHLSAWGAEDWETVNEVIVGMECDPLDALAGWLQRLRDSQPECVPRLAMPVICREWEQAELLRRVEKLWNLGFRRWEVPSLGMLKLLNRTASRLGGGAPDISADWPLYVVNPSSAASLLECGIARLTLSPECDEANARALMALFGGCLVMPVYQDVPLFISEHCPQVGLGRDCRSEGQCAGEPENWVSRSGERIVVIHRGCRTVVINQEPLTHHDWLPFMWAGGVGAVRMDFVWRRYAPDAVVRLWRRLRASAECSRPAGARMEAQQVHPDKH